MSKNMLIVSLEQCLQYELTTVRESHQAYTVLRDKTTRFAKQLSILIELHTAIVVTYESALAKAHMLGV